MEKNWIIFEHKLITHCSHTLHKWKLRKDIGTKFGEFLHLQKYFRFSRLESEGFFLIVKTIPILDWENLIQLR